MALFIKGINVNTGEAHVKNGIMLSEETRMMLIPKRLYRSDTVHRNLTGDPYNGLISCGFLYKHPDQGKTLSDINLQFDHYGGLLVLSGHGTHVDCEGHSYLLSQGSFVQRLPGKVHTSHIEPDGEWLEFFICIGRDLFDSLARLQVLEGRLDVLTPGITPALVARMESFLAACRQTSEQDLSMLLSEALQILFTVTRMHRLACGNDEMTDWVDKACRMMGELAMSPEGHVRVETVAGRLGIGVERFRKGFKERMGMPPGEYLRNRRMNVAQSMLAEGHRSVKEIALTLGFSDASTFSKQFRQAVGVSPQRFRAMY